jgi:S-adenosylmethionine hydrolase
MHVTEKGLEFRASGVVTLTTDFGLADPFVGVMKGRIVGRHPDARIIDLTHEIPAHWPAEAGFWLARSFRYFPPGTVHVAVVDPGVGSARACAAIEAESHLFLAPDNGLLGAVLESVANPVARRVDDQALQRAGVASPSATFHGRDIFAPLAAELAAGRLQPADLGAIVHDLVPGWLEEPTAGLREVAGTVVTVDRFGNLITNIERAHVRSTGARVVVLGATLRAIRDHYAQVAPGELLALFGSDGLLEIAARDQSAARITGAGVGTAVHVELVVGGERTRA